MLISALVYASQGAFAKTKKEKKTVKNLELIYLIISRAPAYALRAGEWAPITGSYGN
jgi:hypothetical protein